MDATTQKALNPSANPEALAWIALVITAITILVSGAFVVRQVNTDQAQQATQVARPAE